MKSHQQSAVSATGKHFPHDDQADQAFDGPVFASIIAPDTNDFATVAELQARMDEGVLSAVDLVTRALARIAALDRQGPCLNAVIEINPDALCIAQCMDTERANGIIRGRLHGIPVLLKDNIDTGDRMQTSAGSLALTGAPAPADALVVERLRNAGAVILGKANLSEWAGLRDPFNDTPAGWSQRGGQTRSALGLGMRVRGSSSGAAVAVSAGFVALAVGTETSGSIVSPAFANQVVGMRPTLGLLSQDGLVPVSKRQDTPGPMARTVADAALLLSAMSGAAESDLDPQALLGVRLGYPSVDSNGDPVVDLPGFTRLAARLERAGATLVPVELSYPPLDNILGTLLMFDLKQGLTDYLARRPGIAVRNIADVIAFNNANLAEEGYGQGGLEEAHSLNIPESLYQMAATWMREQSQQLIDDALQAHDLQAFVEINTSMLLVYGAAAGYPGLFVPAGLDDSKEPTGLNFTGGGGSDQCLLSMGYAFEQAP